MSHPPNAPMVAPSARCRASNGESFRGASSSCWTMSPTVTCARNGGCPRPGYRQGMTRLSLTTADPLTLKADALVVGAYQAADGPVAADERFAGLVAAAALAGATGKSGSVATIPGAGVAADRVVVVGLGKPTDADSGPAADRADQVRKAAGATSRALAGQSKVVSTLSLLDDAAAAEGHLLGAYVFETYKKPGSAPVD